MWWDGIVDSDEKSLSPKKGELESSSSFTLNV